MAEAHLAARFNRPGHEVVDHHTYVLAGDGDLMEGVAHEAASLAGHLELGKLVVFYDSNRICLAGSTNLSFTDDVAQVFEGYGWHVADGGRRERPRGPRARDRRREGGDGPALARDRADRDRLRQPEAGHLRRARLAAQRRAGDRDEAQAGLPLRGAVLRSRRRPCAHLRGAVERGKAAEAEWRGRFEAYRKAHPDLAAELERVIAGELPKGWDADIPTFTTADKPIATRSAGGKVINAIAARVPELLGGSADLNSSTETALKGAGDFQSPATAGGAHQGAVGGEWGYGGPERPLRRARARDGGRLLRPRAPRRRHPVLGHVLHVRRLHAPGHPPRRAHEAAARSTSSPTTASAWARTGRPTSRSSTRRRSARSRSSR